MSYEVTVIHPNNCVSVILTDITAFLEETKQSPLPFSSSSSSFYSTSSSDFLVAVTNSLTKLQCTHATLVISPPVIAMGVIQSQLASMNREEVIPTYVKHKYNDKAEIIMAQFQELQVFLKEVAIDIDLVKLKGDLSRLKKESLWKTNSK